MNMTPRQIAAFLHFLDRELAIEEATNIGVLRLAQFGKSEDVADYIRGLTRDGEL